MKKLKSKRMKRIALIAVTLLIMITGYSFAVSPKAGIGTTTAMALVIGGVTLTDEQEKAYNALEGQFKSIIEKNEKGYISETKAKELMETELKTYMEKYKLPDEVKSIGDFIESKMLDLSKAVKTLQENGKKTEKTFNEELKEIFETKKDEILAAAKGGPKASFQLKTAATVVTSANFGSGVVLGYREQQVDGTLPNEFDPIMLISRMNGGPGSNPLSWVQRTANGGAAGYAENSEAVEGTTIKALMDFNWEEASANAVTIAVMSILSKRAVNNYPLLEQEVRQELLISLRNKLNSEIINGTDSTTSLKGINGYATTLVTAGLEASVPMCNMWDVLLLAWKQSRKAYKGSRPNAILIGIGAGVDMDMQKNEFGQYIMPQFMVNQDKTLKGVPIIEADDITDGNFLIGDFSKCLFNMVQDVTIDIGWMNDQFGKNQFTLRAELEGMQRVKSQFAGSFVKGNFATAIAALKTEQN